ADAIRRSALRLEFFPARVERLELALDRRAAPSDLELRGLRRGVERGIGETFVERALLLLEARDRSLDLLELLQVPKREALRLRRRGRGGRGARPRARLRRAGFGLRARAFARELLEQARQISVVRSSAAATVEVQDLGRDAVEEPAVVADDDHRAGERDQRV